MRLRRYSPNAVEGVLVGAIDSTQTTLVTTDVTNHPSFPYTIQIGNEVMLVTSGASTTLTVERGYDDTPSVAHANGSVIRHVATGDDFRHLWREPALEPAWGSEDDEFDGDTIDGSWTECAAPTGTTTWTQTSIGTMDAVATPTMQDQDWAALLKPIPGTFLQGDSIWTAFRYLDERGVGATMYGLCFTDGTTTGDNMMACAVYSDAGSDNLKHTLRYGTRDVQSASTSTDSLDRHGPWIYLRLTWVSSNTWRGEISINGETWIQYLSDTSFTMTPTHMGLALSGWDADNTVMASYQFFRTSLA